MPRTVRIENLGAAVWAELQYFDMELQGQIQKAVDIEAQALKKDVINTSPKDTGEYKKGWRLTRKYQNARRYIVVVHNKPRYRLVHLLENGRNDGEAARPHLFAAQERAMDKLERRIDDIIGSW